jgi:hypothetical protein
LRPLARTFDQKTPRLTSQIDVSLPMRKPPSGSPPLAVNAPCCERNTFGWGRVSPDETRPQAASRGAAPGGRVSPDEALGHRFPNDPQKILARVLAAGPEGGRVSPDEAMARKDLRASRPLTFGRVSPDDGLAPAPLAAPKLTGANGKSSGRWRPEPVRPGSLRSRRQSLAPAGDPHA